MIRFDNWTLTHDGEIIARQFDHKTRSITITGDIPSGWNWDLLVKVKEAGAFDIIPLTASEGALSAVLTEKQLSIAGYYTLQLRGNQGEPKKHTNQLEDVYIPASLSGDAHWPELPTKFSEMEARVKADADRAAAAAGKAGRYYMPKVTQPSASTMQMSFTPSEPEMTEVNSVKVSLPAGPQGEDGCGVEKYAFDPEIWRWVMKYTDGHINTYPGFSPHDRDKFVVWRDTFEPERTNVAFGEGPDELYENAKAFYTFSEHSSRTQYGVELVDGSYVAVLRSEGTVINKMVTKCHSWGAYTAQVDFNIKTPPTGAKMAGLIFNLFEGYTFDTGTILAYINGAGNVYITDNTSGSAVQTYMLNSGGSRVKVDCDTWYTAKMTCGQGVMTLAIWPRDKTEADGWQVECRSGSITAEVIEAQKALRIQTRASGVAGLVNTVYVDNLLMWEELLPDADKLVQAVLDALPAAEGEEF